ncbi:superkiller complex protein 3 isoform X1 [Andrena cerasifolii]|uniref:superkiller complex protein 3 isoform X1 n=1 Tax=Andrena cerasifolii TaxID=2819439 RepID=UPI004037ACD7
MSAEIKVALKEARKSFKQNEYSDVIKKCKEILKKDKDNYSALVLLAASMKQIEEYNSQVPLILQKAIKIQPDNPLAWQGLAAYYEKHCNSNDCCSELMSAYNKLLQMDSDFSDFSYILDKVSELSSKFKDNTLLVPIIENLSELREKILHNEKVKLINKLLEQILIDNFNNLTEHRNLLKSVLTSLINDVDISSRQEYYRKYLKLLYDEGELMTLREEAINMHQQFPQDALPLEYMCRVYYEQNILGKNYTDMSITQYYEALIKLNMESEIAAIAKAMYLKKADNLIPAREILKDILLVKPYSVHGWIILSEINMKLYCWKDAENAIRQALNCEEHIAGDDLAYEMELILMEAMSRTNNKQKWEIALQMCENHLRRRHSTRLELIHTRIGVLLDDFNIYNKLSNLESQCQIKIEVNILRALYLKQHKQLEEAANALDSTLETSEAWLLLGLIYWEMAEYNYSLMAFLNGIKGDRYNWECLAYLGDYYRKYGNDMIRSRRCYQTALQINPNSEQAGIGLSTVYRHLKDQDANIQLLQRLTMKDSGPKWAWLQLGLQYLDHGDALQAIKAFQRVIRADPNDSRSWEVLADAYIVRGAHTSALKSYQRALQLCTTSLYSMLQLANIKLIIGQYSEVKKDFEDILAREPHCVPALKGLVETCLALAKENIAKQFLGRANHNLQQAMDSLTIAITEHNDTSCIWKLLGDTCYRAALMPEKYSYLNVQSILLSCGDTKCTTLIKRPDLFLLSIRCYCCALSISPQSALLWHDLASCYLMQLHLDPLVDHKTLAGKCIGAAKHAVKLCPSMWLHWNLLGVICMSPYIQNYALAQHAYIMASDKDLNNAVVWSNLGTLYLHIGNLYKANEAYSQAQRADPAYVNSWLGQALIAEMMNRKDAMDLFRHSTQLGYHDQAAVGYTHWVLTVLLNSNTKKDSLYTYMIENMHAIYVAADVMNWYIEHHPDDYYARNAYGLLLERQKLYKSAAEQFTAAVCLSLNEEKDLACINLARVLIQLKKYSEAVKLCRAVKGNNYNSQCYLALSLFKDAQYEDSYAAYEAALRLFANTEIEKAYTLCAMAAIAYTFQGVNDAKTLLFQCIQVQPPIIAAFLAAASLGILHGDLNLTTLVLNELKPYENNPEYGLHVANLSAYFHLIGNNTKSAVAILSKATFRHPGDVRYWVQLLKVLLQTDLQTFNKCAQKTLFLSRNIAGTNVIHVACASSLSYFAQNLDTNSSRSIQKLLFTYPSHVESWATFIAAFLPRSVNMDSTWNVQWISVLTSIILNYQCTDSMVKWLCGSKQKLTQFT